MSGKIDRPFAFSESMDVKAGKFRAQAEPKSGAHAVTSKAAGRLIMEVPHQPAGVAAIECGLIAANAVLSQPASCPGERIQSVRLVLSFEGDHRKNLRAATSCGE